MIIDRFGDTYASAYVLPKALADDDWQISRPPVLQPVAGAGGALDMYGIENFPVSPLVVRKNFRQTDVDPNDYSGIEDAIDALKLATISVRRSKLWGLKFDGTRLWAWAKCTSVKAPWNRESPSAQPVSIEFSVPEGVWYGETQQGLGDLNTSMPTPLVNAGNYPTPLYFRLDPGAGFGGFGNLQLVNNTNGFQWTFQGGAVLMFSLVVDAEAYKVVSSSVSGDVDRYSYFSRPAAQIPFMLLSPGSNSMTLTGATGAYTLDVLYYDAYIL